jgi:Na+/melibiose symporter-like transporter
MDGQVGIPRWRIGFYAAGAFGSSLLSTAVGTLLAYFYLPPDTGAGGIPLLVERGSVFLGMTVIGLASFTGGLIGLLVDPAVGMLSDRSKARIGRRRLFMLAGAPPLALLSWLVFMPPFTGSSPINAAWVFVAVILSSTFTSVYGLPWTALQPELGPTSRDRMFISTLASVGWTLGFLASNAVFPLKDLLQSSGASPVLAFRMVMGGFAILGCVSMLLPVIFIDERRWGSSPVPGGSALRNLGDAFRNRDFVVNSSAMAVYGIADRLMLLGFVYFVTILMKREESVVFWLLAAVLFASLALYIPVNLAVRRAGKKRILLAGFAFQALALGLVSTFSLASNAGIALVLLGIVIASMSLVGAITTIVPSALAADIIRADTARTGVHKEASFGGAATLIGKIPASLPGLLFPSLLLLGRSRENPAGVRLTALIGFFLMFVAIAILTRYDERRTLATLGEGEGTRGTISG